MVKTRAEAKARATEQGFPRSLMGQGSYQRKTDCQRDELLSITKQFHYSLLLYYTVYVHSGHANIMTDSGARVPQHIGYPETTGGRRARGP